MNTFSLPQFLTLIQTVTDAIKDKPLDLALDNFLNEKFHASSKTFKLIECACHDGIETGALCAQEAGGIKYGRVFEPSSELSNYSVDLVYMKDVKGPRHCHPLGEIDLIIPIGSDAEFDNRGAGWMVYEPGSIHSPTVCNGDALVLYLLPEGKIEFIRKDQ
ncbi:MAG: DUF4863 domain-containing protein [Gammaproteobacteria bacterium]|nr:MAG: DUF4863 domain-containing protein [Gammaproteobacteria bacterium]